MEATGDWTAVLPPLLAIGLALALRQVVVALAVGVWLGASLAAGDPASGLLRAVDAHVVGVVADSDHASVIVFTLLLGGMVGLIARAGGAHGLAEQVTRLATDRRRGQLAGWGLGLVVFFDDYANSLLVGTSMRPITDRLRISREKLAFLVDATAAPVASLAVISSWIGVEVGAIAQQYSRLGLDGDAYRVFLQTIPYRFYPILMLVFGLALVLSRRDFGPMRRAERRALEQGQPAAAGARPAADFADERLEPPADKPRRWINAALPVAVVVIAVFAGMWLDGRNALLAAEPTAAPSWLDAFAAGDSYRALLWAAALGGLCALVLALAQRLLTLAQAMEAWLAGLRSMLLAVVILVLAWSLGSVCDTLGTGDWLVAALGDWLPAGLLPAAVFLAAALVAFATGSSWGTMGLLFPLVIPLAAGLDSGDQAVLLGSISSVLAGAVWGDHCSPISDTTIISSLAASCDHIDHVRTQLPYALLVGLVALVVGDLGCGLGWYPPWLALLLGAALVVGAVFLLGRTLSTRA